MPTQIPNNYGGLGLLAGLSRGLMSGLESYRDERKYQDDKTQKAVENSVKENALIDERAKTATDFNIKAKEHGLLPEGTDEKGGTLFGFDKEYQKRRDDENKAKAIEKVKDIHTKAFADQGRTVDFDANGQPIPGTAREVQKIWHAPVKQGLLGPAANLTPGQKALDQKFSTVYNDYILGGQKADVENQIEQLSGVARDLENGKELSGALRHSTLPRFALAKVDPESVAAQDAIGNVVQRTLRPILGAQFTEKEGEGLIKRSWDPVLPPKLNAPRVARLVKQVQAVKANKDAASAYFGQFGTMKGYVGPTDDQLKKMLLDDQEILAPGGAAPQAQPGNAKTSAPPAAAARTPNAPAPAPKQIAPGDQEALNFVNDPKNARDPHLPAVIKTLKLKGLL